MDSKKEIKELIEIEDYFTETKDTVEIKEGLSIVEHPITGEYVILALCQSTKKLITVDLNQVTNPKLKSYYKNAIEVMQLNNANKPLNKNKPDKLVKENPIQRR